MQIVPEGLKGVAVADTTIGAVDGEAGFYHYRGHEATELARTRTLEEVWTLLVDGALPPAVPVVEPGVHRRLTAAVGYLVDEVADRVADPLVAVRVALLALADAEDRGPLLDRDTAARRGDALRLAAVVPTVLARHYRRRRGLAPVEPDPTLGHAADHLRMVTGREPDPRAAAALERYLVATVDHGFNASTFTARVVASTGADMAGALVAAVGALSGPLHGGAPSRCLAMIEEIGRPERAAAWVRERLAAGERIMGFGHAVYRTRDPRGVLLREAAESLGGDLVERAAAIEEVILAELAARKPDQRLVTNVEYWAAVVMELAGLPRELFTPTFTVSRTIGWTAHVLEQASRGRIIRPSARYVGPEPAPAALA